MPNVAVPTVCNENTKRLERLRRVKSLNPFSGHAPDSHTGRDSHGER